VVLFFRLLLLLLIIPTEFGFALIGEKYQMELGPPTDTKTSSVEEIERDTGDKFINTRTDSTGSNGKRGVNESATEKKDGVDAEVATGVALIEQKEESHPPAITPHVAQTPPPPPMTSSETQSVVFFWKTDQGSVESRVAKVKGDGDVLEITSEDSKLSILGSRLVLVIALLTPGNDIQKLTKERVDLASSRYDKAEKMDKLKMLLADGRAKWNTIQATPEAPVVASDSPDSLPELDVPTSAGVEEPAPRVPKVETKPKTGWENWILWAKSFAGKALGR